MSEIAGRGGDRKSSFCVRSSKDILYIMRLFYHLNPVVAMTRINYHTQDRQIKGGGSTKMRKFSMSLSKDKDASTQKFEESSAVGRGVRSSSREI